MRFPHHSYSTNGGRPSPSLGSVLRTCISIFLWIFFIVFLLIFLLVLGLGIGCLLFSIDTPNMTNQFVKNVESWKAVVIEPSLKRHDFSPSPFKFSETNTVYEVEFVPRHPFLHEMSIKYDCTDEFHKRHDKLWIPPQKVSIEISIIHEEEVFYRWHAECVYSICERHILKPGREIEHRFGQFNVARFPWHYKDRIRLRVQMLTPVSGESFLFPVKHPLAVQELHPHVDL